MNGIKLQNDKIGLHAYSKLIASRGKKKFHLYGNNKH